MHLLQKNQVMHKLLQITVQSCKRECSVRFASKVLFFEKVLNFSVWIQNKKMYYIRSNSFEVLRSFSIWNLEAKFTFEKINLIKSLRKHNKQTLVHSKSEFRILAKIKDKKRLFNYRTRAIITRGLYIFYPLFEVQKRFFKGLFS